MSIMTNADLGVVATLKYIEWVGMRNLLEEGIFSILFELLYSGLFNIERKMFCFVYEAFLDRNSIIFDIQIN